MNRDNVVAIGSCQSVMLMEKVLVLDENYFWAAHIFHGYIMAGRSPMLGAI